MSIAYLKVLCQHLYWRWGGVRIIGIYTYIFQENQLSVTVCWIWSKIAIGCSIQSHLESNHQSDTPPFYFLLWKEMLKNEEINWHQLPTGEFWWSVSGCEGMWQLNWHSELKCTEISCHRASCAKIVVVLSVKRWILVCLHPWPST